MKLSAFLCFLVFFLNDLSAQQITFSDHRPDESSDINFEIIGKQGNNFLVYKNIRWKHVLGVYDSGMKLVSNDRLKFMPDKTFNVDFITYPDHFFMLYQFQKGNIVHCMAVKMGNDGNPLSEPFQVDTSKIGAFADKRIYTVAGSEDKSHILVYKMIRRGDNLTLVSKVYNSLMELKDSSRHQLNFNERRDIYGELSISNEGTLLFVHEKKKGNQENVWQLDILIRPLRSDSLQVVQVPLGDKYIDEVMIKIDNLNRSYLLNSLFCNSLRGNITGLFTAGMSWDEPGNPATAFNYFPDTLRQKMNNEGQYNTAFNNVYIRNAILRRDGGFIVNLEDFSMRTTGNSFGRSRYDYLYNYPYGGYGDYYYYNPSYYNYYRPFYNRNLTTTHYYYDNIVAMSLDRNFGVEWNSLLVKKQGDVETDNFLSFSNIITGGEIHYLFMEAERRNQVVNNYGLSASGRLTRYGTLRGNSSGYSFMPKLSKQVGPSQVIMPCMYRGNIAFALIDFTR